MAGRKGTTPKAVVRAQTPGVNDSALQRAFDVVTRAVQELQSRELATSAFSVFTTTADGLVPAPTAASGRFLRDDGVWSNPTSAVTSVTAGSAMVAISPTTGAVVVDVSPANFTGIPESGVTSLVADLAARPIGSGTINTLSKWTGTSALGNSLVTDDGTIVTVSALLHGTGAATLDSTLNVVGNFSVNTSKVTIDASTGNTVIAGTLALTPMTTGSVLFAGASGVISQDNANLFWDDGNNRLGVGTNAPSVDNHTVGTIASTGASAGLFVGTTQRTQNDPVLGFLETNVEFTQDATNTVIASSYGTGVNAAFQVFRARGTKSGASAIQSGDSLGSFGFTGATSATAHHSGSFLIATATENWVTGSNVGTKLDFYTTKNATSAVTGRQVRLTLENDGTVIIPGAVNNGTTALIVGAAANTKTTTVGVAEFTKDATALFTISAFGTGAVPALNFLHGRGTAAATTAAQSGDILGQIVFAGATGPNPTNTLGSSFISGLATENWSPGYGSRLAFTTCLNGGTTRSEKLGIENDGGITLSNSAAATVSAASTSRLRSNTQLQVSNNGGAYVTLATGTGTANRITKWSNTTGLLADSLVSDDGTTFAINTNKFTVTEASGNTSVAGTLGVTGLSTLTGGFTLGADSSANSHKITNLTNGSSAQDAAAFGQIATAVNAAVSGTANTLAKFTGTNVVGNSNITDNGTTVSVGIAASFASTVNTTGSLTVNSGATVAGTLHAGPTGTVSGTPITSVGNGNNVVLQAQSQQTLNQWALRIRDLSEGDFSLYDMVAGSRRLYIDASGQVSTVGTLVVGGSAVYLGSSTGPIVTTGTGSPNGVVTAPVGSLYTDTSGGAATTLYVKESGTGNTGWIAK